MHMTFTYNDTLMGLEWKQHAYWIPFPANIGCHTLLSIQYDTPQNSPCLAHIAHIGCHALCISTIQHPQISPCIAHIGCQALCISTICIPQISPCPAYLGWNTLCISTIWHPSDQSLPSTPWLQHSLYQYNMASLRSALAKHTLVTTLSVSVQYGILQISPCYAHNGCHALCISTIWHHVDQPLPDTPSCLSGKSTNSLHHKPQIGRWTDYPKE